MRRTSELSRLTAAKVKNSAVAAAAAAPPLLPLLSELSKLFTEIQKVVHTFYRVEGIVADIIAEMTGRTYVKPVIFVRLAWREENKGVYFEITNPLHRLALLDLYIRFNLQTFIELDPLFKDDMGCMLYHNLRESGGLATRACVVDSVKEATPLLPPAPAEPVKETTLPLPEPVKEETPPPPEPVKEATPPPAPVKQTTTIPKPVPEPLPNDITIRGPGMTPLPRQMPPLPQPQLPSEPTITYMSQPVRPKITVTTPSVAAPTLEITEPPPQPLPLPPSPVQPPPRPAPVRPNPSAYVLTTRPPPKRKEIILPRRELPEILPPRPAESK